MTILHETSEARSIIKTNVVALYPLPAPSPNQMALSGLLLLGFMLLLSVVLLLSTRGQLSYKER